MADTCSYLIQIRGRVDVDELNALSPCHLTVEQTTLTWTRFRVCADQAGLVGVVRRLHGLGFVFLSVIREEAGEPGPAMNCV